MNHHQKMFIEHLCSVLETKQYMQMLSFDIQELLTHDDREQLIAKFSEMSKQLD